MSARTLNPVIHVALLAGGCSSRMGADKRYLRLNGEFVIDRMVRLASDWASRNSGNHYVCGAVEEYPSIPDRVPNLGPIGGLDSVVRLLVKRGRSEEEWVLLIPVDMPMLSLSVFERLAGPLSEKEDRSAAFDAIRFTGFELPCLFRVSDRLRERVTRLLAEPSSSARSLRRLLQSLPVLELPVEAETLTCMENVNTPVDWVRVRKVL